MVATYQQHYDGIAVFNFASSQQGVLMYPDLVKVQVSLEDGSIIGLDAKSFIIAHKKRDIRQPEISELEAQKMLNPGFSVKAKRLRSFLWKGDQKGFVMNLKGNMPVKIL